MGGIILRIRASSLIEVIVASVVFMIIFLISLQMIGKISTKSNIPLELICAHNKINEILQTWPGGKETAIYRYTWGEIIVLSDKYQNFNDLTLLKIKATLFRNNKIIIRYFIIPDEEQE